MRVALFLFILVLVNLPYANEAWKDEKVRSNGHDVVATVVDAQVIKGSYLVDYRLPKSDDRKQLIYSATVDLPTYERAQAADVIAVRMVAGDPEANRPLGLIRSSFFTVTAVVGDAVLAVIALGAWYRRRHPGSLLDPAGEPGDV